MESLEHNYARPIDSCQYFTDNYEKVPYYISKKENKQVNYWFLIFIPYLVSLFSSFAFEEILLYWLTNCREGMRVLERAINCLDDYKINKHTKIGKVLRKKGKATLSTVAVGTAWIRSTISIGKFVKFKHHLNNYDPQRVMPAANDIKAFSGSLRTWITKTAPFKLVSDTNKTWFAISNGAMYLAHMLKVFLKEDLIQNCNVYIKYSWDARNAVKSTPTILTASLAGKYISPENCITLSAFKLDEKKAMQETGAWKAMQEMIRVVSLKVHPTDALVYYPRHIVSPDLCALRSSVDVDNIVNPVQSVWKIQQIALILEMVFSGENYLELFSSCPYELITALTNWKQAISDPRYRELNVCLPLIAKDNSYHLYHLSSCPRSVDDFCRHYWLSRELYASIERLMEKKFHNGTGKTLVTCPFCFYSWRMRKFYFKYTNLGIWQWKRQDIHWKNCIGYKLEQTGICIAHAINRILFTMLDLTCCSDEEDMRHFANIFNTGSKFKEFMSKTEMQPLISEDLQPYVKLVNWTNNGIKISEKSPQHQAANNGMGSTKVEFNQILFKMADKIMLTCKIWIPIMLNYFREKEERDNSILTQMINSTQRQQGINQRQRFDSTKVNLWLDFQEVWMLCKAPREQWIEWKQGNYSHPCKVLGKFHANMSINVGESAEGIADYVHIVCFHLTELFDKFGLAPTEYQNFDSEAIHHMQKIIENALSLKGGCNHDDTEDLIVFDQKKFVCRLGEDPLLEEIFQNNKAPSYR